MSAVRCVGNEELLDSRRVHEVREEKEKIHVEVKIVRRKFTAGISSRFSPNISSRFAPGISSRFDDDKACQHSIKILQRFEDQESKKPMEKVTEKMSNSRRGPFIELGALHKVLDKLKPEDEESASAWYASESCCMEIIQRFQNLLNEWSSDRKSVDECLVADGSLIKCEYCGVIKCAEQKIRKSDEKLLDVKRDEHKIESVERQFHSKNTSVAKTVIRSTRKDEIMRNSHPAVPPREKLARRSMNRSYLPKKTSFKATDTNTNSDKTARSTSTKITANKKSLKANELYELPGNEASINGDSFRSSVMETVKYLARGNFYVSEDKKIQSSFDKSGAIGQEYWRKLRNERKHSFGIHGSRDVDYCRDFFLSDRLRLEDKEFKTDYPVSHKIQLRSSETSAFSSSSAENLIRQWVKPNGKGLEGLKDLDLSSKVHTTVSPTPDNVQKIRAEIAEIIQKFASCPVVIDDNLCDKPEVADEKNPSTEKSVEESPLKKNEDKITINNPEARRSESCNKNLISALSVKSSRSLAAPNSSVETSERFERQILYDEISSREANSDSAIIDSAASKILLTYRKILESDEEMDWESFEELVTALHPSQRELWCDICKAVSNEAKRVADETGATTEVCIEINPLPCREKNGNKVLSRGNEISFELDMTLQDIPTILKNKNIPDVFTRSIGTKSDEIED